MWKIQTALRAWKALSISEWNRKSSWRLVATKVTREKANMLLVTQALWLIYEYEYNAFLLNFIDPYYCISMHIELVTEIHHYQSAGITKYQVQNSEYNRIHKTQQITYIYSILYTP